MRHRHLQEPSEGLDAEHIVLLVVVGAPCLLGIVIVLLSCAYARMTTEHSVHYWTVASIIVSVIGMGLHVGVVGCCCRNSCRCLDIF